MTNRLDGLNAKMTKDPVYNMRLLLDRLQNSGTVPEPNKYYVFVYTPKTKNIQYDQHPFIVSGSNYQWGFTALNEHWGEMRRYTWAEMRTPLFEITEDEVETVSNLPIQYFRNS